MNQHRKNKNENKLMCTKKWRDLSLNGWEFIFHDMTKLLRENSKMKQIYCWMTNISSTTEINVRNKLI